jgi:outer membrane protein assembly factor BamA
MRLVNLRPPCRTFLLVFLAAWFALAFSFASGAPTFQLIAVKIIGSSRYTSADIIGETGLRIGQQVTEEDFKKASQLLGETGVFGDVSYRYEYSGTGATLDLQLSDASQFVPARFENFVWFTDQELADKLRQRVPLFLGVLPTTGNLPDQVSDALQALLIERNIAGKADYLRADKLGGGVDAIAYSVQGPHITIRNVEFAGGVGTELKPLEAEAKNLAGEEFVRSVLQLKADKNFLPVYLERGYLKASFGTAQAKVVQDGAEGTLVDVTFPVSPGPQYKFASAQWTGDTIFSADKLSPLVQLKTGEPANAIKLNDDLESVRHMYGTKGYMAAQIKPVPQLDDDRLMVTYRLEVVQGDVYHMGELDIHGLDTPTNNRLKLAWKLAEDDVYDSSYPSHFLEGLPNSVISVSQWNVTVHETVDHKDKTVDVTLRFDPHPLH